MIQPVLAHDALLADIRAAALEEPDAFHIWWLGQSGFLIGWQGKHLLIDPYLSDALARKYAGTDKPHTRLTALPIEPHRLDFIDVVTSSHHHTDHLDGDTLSALLAANGQKLTIVVPNAHVELACQRLGCLAERLRPIDDGQTIEAAGFQIHALPSAHEAVEQDELGRHKFLGYVFRFGRWAVYHSGDTVVYAGMIPRLRRWQIDVALLPINGRDAQRNVPGNLSGAEAAWLAREVRARLVIPCHYDMFAFNTVRPDEFLEEAARRQQACCVLQCGQRWSSRALDAAS